MKIKSGIVYILSGAISYALLFLILISEKIGTQFWLAIFSLPLKFNSKDFFNIRRDYDVLEKKILTKAILAIPSFGCEHYFKNGGCGMCGFNEEIKKYKFRQLHPAAIIFLTKLFLFLFQEKTKKAKQQIDSLYIFMAGSFFNKRELPEKAQAAVFSFFSKSGIKKLAVESRPEYILEAKENLAGYNFPGKQLEIAIGLETANDEIRNKHVKKNILRGDYQEAVKTIKEAGMISSTYVLIGLPFLSKEEVAAEAVASARFAWETGSDIVNFESYSVQSGTSWAQYYARGNIHPPSLWTIVEVIISSDAISNNWYLGEFSDWPEPVAKSAGCPECEIYLSEALSLLRQKHNINIIQNLPACTCHNGY